MPWTLAHPAAILPLARLCPRWLSLPALILGSMAPDFGYYIGAFDLGLLAHSASGLILICLPSGFAAFVLLGLFRRPLVAPIPAPHRQVFLRAWDIPASTLPRRATATGTSVLIGAATHVIWDSFTHATGIGVQLLPELNTHVALVGGRDIRVFNVLQHLSTLLGLVCLALAYRGALARSNTHSSSDALEGNAERWRVLAGVAVIALATGLLLAVSGGPATLSVLVVKSVIYTTSSLLVLYVLASLYWWRRQRDA